MGRPLERLQWGQQRAFVVRFGSWESFTEITGSNIVGSSRASVGEQTIGRVLSNLGHFV